MADLNTTLETRHAIGRQATYQSECLLRSLLHAAHHGDPDSLEMLLRATLPRLIDLTCVSMMAFDSTPSADSLESLREQLHGGYKNLVTAL